MELLNSDLGSKGLYKVKWMAVVKTRVLTRHQEKSQPGTIMTRQISKAILRYIQGTTWTLVVVLVWSQPLWAGENDLVLHRLGECTYENSECVSVIPNTAAFEDLTRDLGFILSPKGLSPADTIGIAGFESSFEISLNVINPSAEYWQTAVEDRDPSQLMTVSQVHFTKGLPHSLEVGGVLSHLHSSDIWSVGTELTWSFHDDFFHPVPNLGARGFVSHAVGASDLNLTTAGVDVITDVPLGVNGMFSFTPYVGYNFLAVFASSRLLDASPADPAPPVESTEGTLAVKPEFVFENVTNTFHRYLGGFRCRFAYVNFTTEVLFSPEVQTYSFKLGMDF
jgi:hypothetical protein